MNVKTTLQAAVILKRELSAIKVTDYVHSGHITVYTAWTGTYAGEPVTVRQPAGIRFGMVNIGKTATITGVEQTIARLAEIEAEIEAAKPPMEPQPPRHYYAIVRKNAVGITAELPDCPAQYLGCYKFRNQDNVYIFDVDEPRFAIADDTLKSITVGGRWAPAKWLEKEPAPLSA